MSRTLPMALRFRKPGARSAPKRAHIFYRIARRLRRKRVALIRMLAVHSQTAYIRDLKRFHAVAQAHDVPVDPINLNVPFPAILPGNDWVEHTREFGKLRDPVINPTPPTVMAGAGGP